MFFREFFILISDYYVISKKYRFFDIILPFIISFIFICYSKSYIVFNDTFLGQIMILLSILAGFNTTAISILISASNKNIDKLKEISTKKEIGGKKISLYQELYIYISYSILIAFFVIIFCLFGYLLPIGELFDTCIVLCLGLFIVYLVLHIMFLNIRNISFLYFSFF
ncbi:hypothetical protein RCZ15_03130 [Capnocytophaga catalasegens]|uniref:ABC transporter permease n=2 Tax=Capnocytophaga catalasegens TaxID=1004260 RepID=A0AAV5AWH1_9FLAO|nr:hypothetical protein RCZ03_09590 [Capnocytophaga catalasegens]GJM49338.1 hypothetical protein RCZ15_03130 [Capnocytophaga catalasegens]GJM52489.1 hypothetical protein RCZ16_08060 [Capnocytophaga catalasegens]